MTIESFGKRSAMNIQLRREQAARADKAIVTGRAAFIAPLGDQFTAGYAKYGFQHPESHAGRYQQTPFTDFKGNAVAIRGFKDAPGEVFELIVRPEGESEELVYATVRAAGFPRMKINDEDLRGNGDVWDAEQEVTEAFEFVGESLVTN